MSHLSAERSSLPWKQYQVAVFRLVVASYAAVCDAALQSLVCESHPQYQGSRQGLYLVSQPSVLCFHGSHSAWFAFGWVVSLVWVLGVPVAITIRLMRARRGSSLGWKRLVVLHQMYKERYWPSLSPQLMRRTMLVVLHAVLLNLPVTRQLSNVALLLVFTCLQAWHQPYRLLRFNVGETVVLGLMLMGSASMVISEGISVSESRSSSFVFVPVVQGMLIIAVVLWFLVYAAWEVFDKFLWARQKGIALRQWVRTRTASDVGHLVDDTPSPVQADGIAMSSLRTGTSTRSTAVAVAARAPHTTSGSGRRAARRSRAERKQSEASHDTTNPLVVTGRVAV